MRTYMHILCWNVNGIRAADRKGLFTWFQNKQPDILCLQEIKASKDQIPPYLRNTPGYHIVFHSAQKKGYSGVATYSKPQPTEVLKGFGIERFDSEGRILISKYPQFTLFNIYFPNGKKNKERLEYKLDFYDTFLSYTDNLRAQGEHIIVCGDFNTAHKEIDLARPKENEKNSGFLPVERGWLDTFIDHGYIDTFRQFHKEAEQYSWWDYKTRARERNVGWRIDYFFINKELKPHLKDAYILPDVMGSDHCPVGIELDVEGEHT